MPLRESSLLQPSANGALAQIHPPCDFFPGEPLCVQGDDVLVPIRPFRTFGQACCFCRHIRQVSPCIGGSRSTILLTGWLQSVKDFCAFLGQRELHCLGKIFDDVESVSNLCGLTSAVVCPCGILSSAITAHHLNFGMRVQPCSAVFGGAIGQEINHPVALQVDQNGAEVLPTMEGEIIYTELCYAFNRLGRKSQDTANNRHPGCANTYALGQTLSQEPSSSQTNGLNQLVQPKSDARKRFDKWCQALRKDSAPESGCLTEASAHLHQQAHPLSTAREVCDTTSVLAMETPSWSAT